MNYRDFKPYSKVSSLTLGGGGIGQVWGGGERQLDGAEWTSHGTDEEHHVLECARAKAA